MLFLVYFFIGDYFGQLTETIFLGIWMLHYVQRTFIFPCLIRGEERMSVLVVIMGALFNAANTYMQGRWIYTLAPEDMYVDSWLWTPQFIIGCIIFIFGFVTNIWSDAIIRRLRAKSNDNTYYIPHGFMYKYVSAPNYLGECLEWLGWAVLTWSAAGALFFVWTFANLAPRAHYTHKFYGKMFGEEYEELDRKALIPKIW